MDLNGADYSSVQTFTCTLDLPDKFPGRGKVSTEWFFHPEAKTEFIWCVEVWGMAERINNGKFKPASYHVAFLVDRPAGGMIRTTFSIKGRLVQTVENAATVTIMTYNNGPKQVLQPRHQYPLEGPVQVVDNARGQLTVWITLMPDAGNYAVPKFEPRYQNEPISLWMHRKYTDMTFVLQDARELHAHKAVLMNASPVFEAMFSHDMQERRDNVVRIPDITTQAMMEVLRFMYTGMVQSNPVPLCKELVDLAERYQLQGLKDACERTLAIAVENSEDDTVALELMPLAHRYSLAGLKSRCEVSILSGTTTKTDFDLLKLATETQSRLLKKVALIRIASGLPENLEEIERFSPDLARETLLIKASVPTFSAVLY